MGGCVARDRDTSAGGVAAAARARARARALGARGCARARAARRRRRRRRPLPRRRQRQACRRRRRNPPRERGGVTARGCPARGQEPGGAGRVAARRGGARPRDPGLERGRARLPPAARQPADRRHRHERQDDDRRAARRDPPRRRPRRRGRRQRRPRAHRRRRGHRPGPGSSASSRASSSRTCTRSPATSPCCSTSSPTTSTATARSRPTATRSCGSSNGPGRRSSRAASASRGSSSPPTTRCPPSRSSPARTTARTPPPRPPPPAPPASATTAIAEALRTFPGVPHRLELVRELRGVRYVNDSKATNIAAARRGVAAYDAPLHLILGGSLKGEDFAPLARDAARHGALGPPDRRGGEPARRRVFDATWTRVRARRRPRARGRARGAPTQSPATSSCSRPACASYDQFDNFEQRGRRSYREPALASAPGCGLPARPRCRHRRQSNGLEPPATPGVGHRVDVEVGHELASTVRGILVTLALVAFGLVMVYSATSASAALGDGNPTYYLERQGTYALLGIVLMVVAARCDFRQLRALAPMLVLVRARAAASPCS